MKKSQLYRVRIHVTYKVMITKKMDNNESERGKKNGVKPGYKEHEIPRLNQIRKGYHGGGEGGR